MTVDCCVFKVFRRSGDGKHLMRFQSETFGPDAVESQLLNTRSFKTRDSSVPSSQSNTLKFSLDFSNYSTFQTDSCFPWRFEKSRVHCS